MLKLTICNTQFNPKQTQPPSGGCVLKQNIITLLPIFMNQPPSGGCVLKLKGCYHRAATMYPAAFRRLCVETMANPAIRRMELIQPPSGGCVLKQATNQEIFKKVAQPPSGGCVLKQKI